MCQAVLDGLRARHLSLTKISVVVPVLFTLSCAGTLVTHVAEKWSLNYGFKLQPIARMSKKASKNLQFPRAVTSSNYLPLIESGFGRLDLVATLHILVVYLLVTVAVHILYVPLFLTVVIVNAISLCCMLINASRAIGPRRFIATHCQHTACIHTGDQNTMKRRHSSWLNSAFVVLLALPPIDAFYLPGAAPHDYNAGEQVDLFVNALTPMLLGKDDSKLVRDRLALWTGIIVNADRPFPIARNLS